MSGQKGRSGKRPMAATQLNDYLADSKNDIPAFLAKLSELALAGNLDALKYMLDRHLGKAKQSLEITPKAPSITGDDLVGISEAVRATQDALLDVGQSPIPDSTIDGDFVELIPSPKE